MLRERADEGLASTAFRKACSQGIGVSCYNAALQIEQVGDEVGTPSEAAQFHQLACDRAAPSCSSLPAMAAK